MCSEEIKFSFVVSSFICEEDVEKVFLRIADLINIQFDKDLNLYSCVSEDIYLFKDVSNKSDSSIEEEINSFFEYSFDEIVDVPLYRFLVLKNQDKFTVLGNIHKLIFDYTSVNYLYSIFNESKSLSFENNISQYYDSLNEYLSSSDFENDSDYWRNNLLNIGEHIKFHNVKSNNYQTIKIPFDEKILNEVSSNLNVSKFNFIAGVFSLYLTRIDGTKGILLKTLISSHEKNIGPFDISTLLKIDYHKDYSFIDYLNEINSVFSDAIEHTAFNIEKLIENDLSFYSIYDFTDFNENIFIKNGEGSALTLNIYPDYLELVYNADLFPYIYIGHASENLESLLRNVLSDPDQIISEINILSDDEISLISEYSQGKKVDFVKDRSLSYDFRQHAMNHPDIIAVDDGVNQISYGDLEKLSNSIAYDLSQNYGIGVDNPVCIMLPRNIDYISAVLSVNKVGAFFIPLDAAYPAKRIEYMIELSQSNVVVTNKQFANSFDFGIDVIYIEDLKTDYDVDVDIQAHEYGLMALMFTSGTTGLPKGVMISNHQGIGMVTAYDSVFHLSPGEVVGIFVSFSFVASYRLYCGLCLGGTCRIFNEREQRDSLLLLKELKEKPMSDVILPPGIGVPIFENDDLKLKYMILAGAKVNELSNKDSNTKIVNFYGMTESIISIATIYDLNKLGTAGVSIGRPAANTWIYILDENGMQVPIGVPGEICISSDFLSPGYYNNPDLTKKYFIDNPYSDCDDNKRMYRSGDMGFYNFEGLIEFLGREDDQLSVRGFRIESVEIINLMHTFDEISQVILDVDYDNLIAYYTTNKDLDVEIIKNTLKEELPYYMIPSLFVELEKIPLNPHGKIDKFALKQIFKENAEIDIEDDVLRTVIDSFKEVLHVESVLMDDDFVALGGNSLSAMKLQILLKDKLGANIFSNEILNLSTPVNISNKIKYDLNVYSNIKINYSFDDLCPLSESQLNVYLDEVVKDMGTGYNNPFKISLKKSYPVSDIKRAIACLADVYKVLSARVTINDENLYFSFDADPEIMHVSSYDDVSFVIPFDLNKSLARFLILDENGESNCLYVDFHHLIFDGSSLNIMIDTLLSLLDGQNIDFVDDGVLRQISFEEFIKDSDYMENARQFYDLMFLDKDEVYELLPSVDVDSSDDFEYVDTFKIDSNLLNSFLRSHSITHNQFFASVFAYALSRFTGSSKVFFNLVEDGRGHVDLSKSVGMFVRTLPLLIDCRNQDVSSFLDYSGELVNSVMKYDLYPYRLLANRYNLKSDILFQYSHDLFEDLISNEESDYKVEDLKQEPMGDLSFYIFNSEDGKLAIRILYSEKFSLKFIEDFAESYKLILREMMDANLLSEINFTSKHDLNLLDSYNQTENDLEFNDILDAFNDNLAKYPDNPLVSYNDVVYSYGESAFLASKIAESLRGMGVKSQDNVAFLVERSELYILSALAIMSIGAVYVPIDDAHPDESIRFMLEDSNAKVLIVSESTYERAKKLWKESIILNISGIVKEDSGILSALDVLYGDLACILYTSGTTGVPKGVKITRDGITSYVDFYVNEYDMKNDSVFGLFASIGFDVGAIRGICAPLYGGSCLDIVPMDIRLDINKINRHFIDHDVTHTTLPTQIARMFIEEVEETSLKVLITGGEKLGEINESPNYLFIDSYGPTESCVAVCAIEEKDKMDPSSIGHLFTNIKAYILDEEARRVPIGAVGELCIAGSQVANGYLNRQKETEESFVKNPFEEDEKYNLMYRTGDLVRVLPDGTFGIVGRRDGQVKVRGNRVELSEVESTIRNIDYVEKVTVQTIRNGTNNELVAYVVTSRKINNLKENICRYVADNKPDYMVPSFVMELDKIPLTINGKVDKRALPEIGRASLHGEYIAPRNENEMVIVEAFEKVFDKEKIGINDDFLSLGGDSLIGIKLLSYLEDYDITMADILSLRTPAAIANTLNDISLDLDIYTVDGGCPLNEAQVSLFTGILFDNNSDFFHIPIYMSISKKYSLKDIFDALDKIFKVHPILGMHISKDYESNGDKGFIESIQENIDLLQELGKTYEDRSLVDLLSANRWNVKRIYTMFRSLLKLFKGEYPILVKGDIPPISVETNFNDDAFKEFMFLSMDMHKNLAMFRIFELDDSYLLLAKCHHMIFDAISGNVFKRDLQLLLDGAKLDVDDSFLRTSAFQRQIKGTDKFKEATEFFDSMFKDIGEAKELVGDNQDKGFSLLTSDLEFDYGAFKSFLADAEIGENLLFIDVFAYALSQFIDGDKVLFSLIDNGRGRFNDYDSIGLYANVVTLLIDCKNQSIGSFVDHSRDVFYGATKYNFYPILSLYKKYGLDSPSIIFQYVPEWINYDGFNEQDDEGLSSEFVEDVLSDIIENIEELPIDFVVQIFQKGETYSIMIANSNKFSKAMIEDFRVTFESILSNIIHMGVESDLSSILKDKNL